MVINRIKYIIILSCFCLVNCNVFENENSVILEKLNAELKTLNGKFKNKKVILDPELSNSNFEKTNIKNYNIIVYYDADCHVCFEELEKWEGLISYFKNIDKSLNINFVLHTENKSRTETNLDEIDFNKSLVFYDKRNSFYKNYNHVTNKAYNTMLVDEENKILFIGSPLRSENLKKHYTKLILEK